MKAIVREVYGGPEVLQLRDVERPTPKPHEVLVKVRASSVNRADWFVMTGTPFPFRFVMGLFKPKLQTIGIDVAGTIEAIGAQVTDLHIGDHVFGEASQTWAEYVCVDASKLAKKPDDVSFEHAAALPVAGVTALQAMENVTSGQRVLINGASGGVGHFAVQIAKSLGAEVTAVTTNDEFVRTLGATHVIDYRKDNTFGTQHYDVIFDLIGSVPIAECRKRLTKNGVYISSASALSWIFKAALMSMLPGPRVTVLAASVTRERLTELAALVSRGAVTPFIDRHYSLDEVQTAMQHQGTGRTRGKSVIALAS